MQAARPARWTSTFAVAAVLSFSVPDGAGATGPGGWDHLATGATATTTALNGRVDSLLSVPAVGLNPASVYAGGVFASAGGNAGAAMIARWDGAAWHSIGAPVISTAAGASVAAIALDRTTGKLYVGGNFVNAGGNAGADFVAVWDGLSWQPACNPTPQGNVSSLQIIGRTLYVGGSFSPPATLATGQSLLACDMDTGLATSTVNAAIDMNGSIYGLTADSAGRLYAAGTFVNMDQIPDASHVAMYDGTWHAMQAGAVSDITRSITSNGTDVYIGSDSLNIAGIATADHVARWDGAAWHAMGSNVAGTDGFFPASTFVNAMAAVGSSLYVTGSFQNAGGQATADEVAQYNGSSWAPMGSDGAGNGPLTGPGNALALFGHQAIVGGNFTAAGGDSLAAYVAQTKVDNQPPTAVLAGGGQDQFVFVHNTIFADGTSSHDPDGTIVSYRWDFGDGATQSSNGFGGAYHRYSAAGTYIVTLVVTDDSGATATTQASYSVRAGPTAAFTFSPHSPAVGENVTFQSTSTDPDGTIADTNWYFSGEPFAGNPNTFSAVQGGVTLIHSFPQSGVVHILLNALECATCLRPCPACFAIDAAQADITIVAAAVPKVINASVTNRVFRVAPGATAITARARLGTSFKITLKAPATLTIAIARTSPGVRRGTRCVALTGRIKPHAKRCTRSTRAGTLTRKGLQPGVNTIAFSGRIGKRALKPGAYTATLSARNATGRAKAVSVRFTVVR